VSARARRRRPTGTAFATLAAAGVIAAALLIVLVLQLSRSGTVKNQLGDKVFDAGKTADLAGHIGGPSSGGPILLPALVGHRDIYLQHLGTDPERGWAAFDAAPPGEDRTCDLVWKDGTFRDPCGGRTYPADGAGLTRYQVTIDAHHHVIVDLRTPLP
jgi:hypothetical protein